MWIDKFGMLSELLPHAQQPPENLFSQQQRSLSLHHYYIASLNHSCNFLAPLSPSGRGVGGEGYFTIHLDALYLRIKLSPESHRKYLKFTMRQE